MKKIKVVATVKERLSKTVGIFYEKIKVVATVKESLSIVIKHQ
jgi:hypothetical protein